MYTGRVDGPVADARGSGDRGFPLHRSGRREGNVSSRTSQTTITPPKSHNTKPPAQLPNLHHQTSHATSGHAAGLARPTRELKCFTSATPAKITGMAAISRLSSFSP